MDRLKVFLYTLVIRTVGRLSTGIDMSFRYGFISGKMLDYIYENKAHGKFFIGRLIDRAYLDNTGWKAIRQRKENLKKLVREAIRRNRAAGIPSVILDVASGPAKYLLEVLREEGEAGISVVCQDIDERWLECGREQARQMGLKNVRFEKGDAFDRDLLLRTLPVPNIVVASGFYDWITDDDKVRFSLGNCAAVLRNGGQLLFTNQAGHLQMELVSRAFVDFNKEPLRMKIRPPELINGWAREAGFRGLETVIDAWGLYSVTRGEK